MVDRLLLSAGRKNVVRTDGLKEALSLMEGSDEQELVDSLRQELEMEDLKDVVQKRFPAARAKASAWTPDSIKALRPPVPCTLCWQISHEAFEAYFPIPEAYQSKGARAKKTWSRSRSYGSGKWTQESALTQLVSFLWASHKKCGGVEASESVSSSVGEVLHSSAVAVWHQFVRPGRNRAAQHPTGQGSIGECKKGRGQRGRASCSGRRARGRDL